MNIAGRDWLAEARGVIACPQTHLQKCVDVGGAGASQADATLRWPGMYGPGYDRATHKIMAIGQIHLASEWSESRTNLGALEFHMRAWLNGNMTAAAFFDRYNREYAELLPQWGPWKKAFGPALEPFDIQARDIVYVNFARCWAAAGEDGPSPYPAMNACARYFPIKKLYDIVKPDAVIVLSGASVFKKYPALMRGIPRGEWTHFTGRQSFAIRTADVALVRGWLQTKLAPVPSSLHSPPLPHVASERHNVPETEQTPDAEKVDG